MDFLQNSLYKKDVERACQGIAGVQKLYKKNILVTGATGIVGSFVVDILRYLNQTRGAGITVYALSRNRDKLEARFGNEDPNLHYVVGDVCAPLDFGEQVECIDYVVHAAANSYPSLFREDPTGTILKNITGTKNVLDAAKHYGASRFLFVSSGEVYGQYETDVAVHKETESGMVDILSPRSCYPLSKQMAENLCACYGMQYNLPIVIIRLCHTFGPNALKSDNRAHMQFIRSAASGADIILKSEGRQERSYMYIADSASAILSALLCGESGQAYNAASTETITIRCLAETCAEMDSSAVHIQLPIPEENMEKSPIQRQVLDGEKLMELGWKAQFSIQEGIEHSISILKGNDV